MKRLVRDVHGVTAVEFALIAPVLFLLFMGSADLCFQAYVQAVLTGAVQKAARDATLETSASNTTALDTKVKAAVTPLVPKAVFTFTRLSYDNYASIAGEPFIDSLYNGVYDGICNHGEVYTDLNSNGVYDLDLSSSGIGGADDIAKYTVTVKYTRLFPLANLIGWGSTVTLTAMTILKNQPYATQTTNSGTTNGTCS